MLSKWKKSACAETAQSSRKKHRADIANRLTWSGPNDTEHEVPFLLSHLSERGGPPAACCDWDTPPRPRQPLPELKPKRGACCVVRYGRTEGRLLPHSYCSRPIWAARSLYCNAIRQMSRYRGKRFACPRSATLARYSRPWEVSKWPNRTPFDYTTSLPARSRTTCSQSYLLFIVVSLRLYYATVCTTGLVT